MDEFIEIVKNNIMIFGKKMELEVCNNYSFRNVIAKNGFLKLEKKPIVSLFESLFNKDIVLYLTGRFRTHDNYICHRFDLTLPDPKNNYEIELFSFYITDKKIYWEKHSLVGDEINDTTLENIMDKYSWESWRERVEKKLFEIV